jgi:hypothetical protein
VEKSRELAPEWEPAAAESLICWRCTKAGGRRGEGDDKDIISLLMLRCRQEHCIFEREKFSPMLKKSRLPNATRALIFRLKLAGQAARYL